MRRKTIISIVGVVLISLTLTHTVHCDDSKKIETNIDKQNVPNADESPKVDNVDSTVNKNVNVNPAPAIDTKPKPIEKGQPKEKEHPKEKEQPKDKEQPKEIEQPKQIEQPKEKEKEQPNVDNVNAQNHSPAADGDIPSSIMAGFYAFVALGFVAIVYITYRSFR